MNKPLSLEDALTAKSARLAEPNALLNMDRPENETLDGDLSEDDTTQTPKQNLER